MAYYSKRQVDGDFEAVVARVTDELQGEGFGVLCDIDVQAKFAEKLGLADYPRYRILGACDPALAERGLEAEPDLGVLLPCNVVVYETDDGGVVVSAVEPDELLSVVDNPALDDVAAEVRERFERVLEAVAAP